MNNTQHRMRNINSEKVMHLWSKENEKKRVGPHLLVRFHTDSRQAEVRSDPSNGEEVSKKGKQSHLNGRCVITSVSQRTSNNQPQSLYRFFLLSGKIWNVFLSLKLLWKVNINTPPEILIHIFIHLYSVARLDFLSNVYAALCSLFPVKIDISRYLSIKLCTAI